MSIDLFPLAIRCNAVSTIQRLFASLFYFGILSTDCENLCKFIFRAFGVSFVFAPSNFTNFHKRGKIPGLKLSSSPRKENVGNHSSLTYFDRSRLSQSQFCVIFTLLDVLRDKRTCPRKPANSETKHNSIRSIQILYDEGIAYHHRIRTTSFRDEENFAWKR